MRKRKTAESKRNISKGLKNYWSKKGRKHAIRLAGTAATGAAVFYGGKKGLSAGKKALINKLRSIDEEVGEALKTSVYDGVTGKSTKPSPVAELILNSKSVKGLREGLESGIKDRIEAEKAKVTSRYTNIPQRTKEAFQVGLNTKPAKENDFFVNVGTGLGKIYKRGRDDIKKLGFSFEPSEEQATRYPRLLEFSRNRRRKVAPKKPLSAQHKAKISKGLQEYYDSIPKREESFLDKTEKTTKAIGRVARSARSTAETAKIISNLYKQFKKPKQTKSIGREVENFRKVSRNVNSAVNDVVGIASPLIKLRKL